ncbi:MAG: DUF998 domain-containing protein [Candidatus Thermoplasmatota archaeon]|nr:DUF998 domain-containing protein [Candidatus Thermoplasmatota archaeon]
MERCLVNVGKKPLILAGTIGPVVTIIAIFVDIYLSPWFSWSKNALSDLGVHPYSYIFNGSLIFEAAMNSVFIYVLYRTLRKKRGSLTLLFISGISLGLVGVFNENSPYDLHLIFALIYFIVFPIAIILFVLRNDYFPGSISKISVVMAIIALAVIIVGILQVFSVLKISGVGLAVPETVEAILLGAWSATCSLNVYIREQ